MSIRSPLVIGYPRTGFTLLISVIVEILVESGAVKPGRNALKTLCDLCGSQISASVVQVFERRGRGGDLIYNDNFRQMAGGPKWLKDSTGRTACFRKYIGVRGQGDFTLFTSHPSEVLNYYEVLHSHLDPALWSSLPEFSEYSLFASVRNPAGTVASACFSLNALASEYIQRFVPANRDNDQLRQSLALYKLTDLNFFEALLGPFKAYYEEFRQCENRYFIMRWEDLITSPIPTVQSVADRMNLPISKESAETIWARIDHVNLTGAHKHNFRVGHGQVGGWRNWLTNTHLALMRDYGFDSIGEHFGYGGIANLDEGIYTPFQRKVSNAIRNGEIIREYENEDLFGFAFNKSNVDLDRFSFKQYDWREHTRIERSSCPDNVLEMETSDVAESACAMVNSALTCWFEVAAGDVAERRAAAEDIIPIVAPLFTGRTDLADFRTAFLDAIERDESERCRGTEFLIAPELASSGEPQLLRSVGKVNIVAYRGRFFALPQAIGPVDFHAEDVENLPGVEVADELSQLLDLLPEATH